MKSPLTLVPALTLTLVLVLVLAGCGGPGRVDPAAAYQRGVDYFKEGKYAKALKYFQSALDEAPPTAQALNFVGVCELYEGNSERAIDRFHDALIHDAEYVPARFNLALAQLEAGETSEAIANLRHVKIDDAPPAYVDYHLGRGYLDQSAWIQAHDALAKHLENHPPTGDVLNMLGVIEVRLNRYADAEETFTRALATDPEYAAAHLNLGLIQQHHFRRPGEARAHYESYLNLVSADDITTELRRQVKGEIKRLADAKPAPSPSPGPVTEPQSTVVQAPPPKPAPTPAPSSPPSSPTVAVTPPPAPTPAPTPAPQPAPTPAAPRTPTTKRRSPVAAASLQPGNRTQATSLFNQGVQQHQRGAMTAAMRAYQQAINADPTFASAYYNLAICHRAGGNTAKALENYERALQANPDYSDARFNYAIVLQEEGYLRDAVDQYEKLLEAHPNEAAAHLSVAGLYAKDRATLAQARKHYEAYVRLQPTSPASREIRRWLEKNQ